MGRINRIVLTRAQIEDVNDYVLEAIRAGHKRNQELVAHLDLWMRDNLPPREDRFRYIDGALQRLARAKKIKPVGGGHYGWAVCS